MDENWFRKGVLSCIIITLLMGAIIAMDELGYTETLRQNIEDSSRFSYEHCDPITRILVDKDTGVMYLVYDTGRGVGTTIMVDADGKPLLDPHFKPDSDSPHSSSGAGQDEKGVGTHP